MIKFLLASHGDLADGVNSSLQIILGKQDNVSTLCAYKEEDFDLKKEISKIISNLSYEDELIIITDLFGGSINNEFMSNLGEKKFHLIAGLNLPLVIELIANQNEENIETLIEVALKNSKESIKYCNKLLNTVEEDEEF